MNKIDYEMQVTFNDDGVTIKFTGEAVRIEPVAPDKVIRPRHIRLVADVQQLMREAMRA